MCIVFVCVMCVCVFVCLCLMCVWCGGDGTCCVPVLYVLCVVLFLCVHCVVCIVFVCVVCVWCAHCVTDEDRWDKKTTVKKEGAASHSI